MRPDLADRDMTPSIECCTDSTPQVAILEATPAIPPAFPKAFDQVIAVRTTDQIAQSTFQQLKKCPHFCPVRALQFSRKRPKQSTPGLWTLRERHLAQDAHCAPSSSNKSSIMAVFPAAAVCVPIQRVVSYEVALRGAACVKDHCRPSDAGGGSNPVVREAGSRPRSHKHGVSAASLCARRDSR